jgi:hypothetical protein
MIGIIEFCGARKNRIVEDTNVNGHPAYPVGPGPNELGSEDKILLAGV